MRRVTTLVSMLAALFGIVAEPVFAGTLVGSVRLESQTQFERPARYYLGPYRGRSSREARANGPQDVVVYVEGVAGRFTAPAESQRIVQRNETFIPHVLPVLSGTRVEFPNRDNFYHNVFSVMAVDRFDLVASPRGKALVRF